VAEPAPSIAVQRTVAAWGEHVARLRTRAQVLDARGFEALRFRGPGTELTLGLLRGAIWIAAGFETTWAAR
jgi:aminopeptidase